MRARIAIVLAAAAVGAGGAGLQHLHASVGPSPGRYRLAVVDRGDVVSSVRASGNLSPERQLLVGAAVPGTVTAVLVSDNQKVNADQVITITEPNGMATDGWR